MNRERAKRYAWVGDGDIEILSRGEEDDVKLPEDEGDTVSFEELSEAEIFEARRDSCTWRTIKGRKVCIKEPDQKLIEAAKRIAELNFTDINIKPIDEAEKGINESGFLTVDNARWFVKTADPERERFLKNEEAAWHAAKALGWTDIVTPTAMTKINGQDAVVQKVLPAGTSLGRAQFSGRSVNFLDARTERVMLFEYVIGSADRHAGNYWMDKKGRLYSIDHGYSFVNRTTYERGFGSGGWEGPWGSSRPQSPVHRGFDRKLVEHVVSNEQGLMQAASKAVGGTPRLGTKEGPQHSQAAMKKRIQYLRDALEAQEGRISLPATSGLRIGE